METLWLPGFHARCSTGTLVDSQLIATLKGVHGVSMSCNCVENSTIALCKDWLRVLEEIACL